MEEAKSCRGKETVAQKKLKAMALNSTSSKTQHDLVGHIIDIKEPDQNWCECCIYRVPINLRKVNVKAYTPQLISIGPFHHGSEDLKPMQEQKQRYSQYFLKRLSNKQALEDYTIYLEGEERLSNKQALEDYAIYLEGEEQNIRNCYVQSFPDIKKDEFRDMMLLDAVFIMELFLRTSSWISDTSRNEEGSMDSKSFRTRHKNDYVLTQPWLSKSIHTDLLLLENQLPIFLLNKLYNDILIPCANERPKHHCFLDLALEYFASYGTHYQALGHSQSHQFHEPIHFTDLVRIFYLPAVLDNPVPSPSFHRTATKLQESGVSFQKVMGKRLLDIRFNKKPILSWFLCFGCLPYFTYVKARLQIPQLKVDHDTECVLRNLIAFEQCHYPQQPYICNYVSIIDSLIHTKDDVELLVEKEVIVHELGSDKEVATLVNGLCKHVVANSTCYGKVIDELNEHYQNSWNRTMTALRLVYFRDPWRASSTVVGIAVLIFTVFNFYRIVHLVF